jgi:hypothetical protein
MTHMEPFQVWKCYLALKLHFTTASYDIVKNRGRVKASKDSFQKRNDQLLFKKLAKTYTDEEIINFLVSNFVSGDSWGGVFDSSSKERYILWKKRIESLSYTFTNDIQHLLDHHGLDSFDKKIIFGVESNTHPYIIKAYLGKTISLETLVILDKLFDYTTKFDSELDDKIIWSDISQLIKKYKPFLKVNKEKYNGIIRKL